MKFLKIFSVLALSALTINMSAETSVMAQLVFSSAEANTNYLISQDDAADNNFGSESCGKITLSPDDYALYAYTEYNSEKYKAVDLKNISNIVVKFQPNAYETAYTLTVSDVVGDFMLVCGNDTITESQNNPYNFTASAIVEFTVNPAAPAYKREAAINTWGTICYPKAINGITGAEVYELTKVVGNDVYGEQVDACEAGKSYVFKATADGEQLFAYTGAEVGAPVETTGMVGNFGPAEIDVPAGMYGINGTSVMEVAAGTKLKANRAYIDVEELRAVPAPARGRKIFNVVGGTTGFEAVEAASMKDGKVMMNGQLVIIKGGKMFNAQGMEL